MTSGVRVALRSAFGGPPPLQAARPHPQKPLNILYGGRDDVNPAVEVLDPVDRHLRDPIAPLLGQQQQLCIEEPLAVLDLRQQLLGRATLDRLEAALGVGEAVAEHRLYKQVVAPRDQLALPLARYRRPFKETRADGQVAVPGC